MRRLPLLEVSQLKMHFDAGKKRTVKAVDGVTFQIREGETFGLVGESGCGKSTLGRVLMRLYQPTEGSVTYRGTNLHALSEKEQFAFNRKLQMIFQDPYASLNPRMTVREIILEPMEIHNLYNTHKARLPSWTSCLRQLGFTPILAAVIRMNSAAGKGRESGLREHCR